METFNMLNNLTMKKCKYTLIEVRTLLAKVSFTKKYNYTCPCFLSLHLKYWIGYEFHKSHLLQHNNIRV